MLWIPPKPSRAVQAFADLRLANTVAPQASMLDQMGMNAWQILASGRVAIIQDGNWAQQDIATMPRSGNHPLTPRLRQIGGRIGIYILLCIGGFIFAVPFLWLLTSSLKEPTKIWLFPPQWIPDPFRFENYSEALTAAPFLRYTFNTMVVVGFNLIGTIFTTSMAAYGFARMRFKGRDVMFGILLATMMLPWAVTMIPKYIIFRNLGWLDTFAPLVVPSWFAAGPSCVFYIFLLRQFFRTIPRDFTDAARIDGAGEFGIYWRVMLPLIRPALTVVAIFTFLYHWNDFLAPLIYLTSPENYTISVGLAAFKGLYATDWHYLMAASTVATLPVIILFFAAQRYFIQGVVLSGLKG